MRGFALTARARADERRLLRYSRERFGERSFERYALLLFVAYCDLRADPDRAGVRRRDDLSPGLRLYHLRHSRERVPPDDRVGAPRHYVAFRADADRIVVARLLHDSMNLPTHSTTLRPGPEGDLVSMLSLYF